MVSPRDPEQVMTVSDDLETEAPRPSARDFSRSTAARIFSVIICLYVIYAGFYIYRTSFVIEGERYFCLFDDAMISMRYARNWVEGAGLTWNPGEPAVEGYTNFLWTAVMAVVHLLPLEDRLTSLAVQVICVGIGLGYVVGTYRLGRSSMLRRDVCVAGSVVTAFYYPLTLWNLQGMETGFLTLLLVWAGAVCAYAWREGRVSVPGGLLLAAAACTRPDALILVVTLAVLFTLWRGWAWTRPGATLGVAVLVWGAYWLVRWRYYGSFFPNTYYLKMGMPVWHRVGVLGLDYLSSTLYRFGVLFVGGVVLVWVGLGRRSCWHMFGMFAVALLYLLWAGGDPWPYDRFICPAMPFAALGLMHGFGHVVERIGRQRAGGPARGRPGLAVAFGCVVAFSLNYMLIREWLTVAPYYADANRTQVSLAGMIQRHTDPEARIAVFWAGAIPYFTDRVALDVLGKSDPRIARETPPVLEAEFPPGHNKFDFEYSLLEQRADAIDMPGGAIWPDLTKETWFRARFRPLVDTIDGEQRVLWVRQQSPYIH